MSLNKKINKICNNPYLLISILGSKGYLNWIPDYIYLKLIYKLKMNKSLNLSAPRSFNEKLQWLKINDRKPLYTKLVDKYGVREYIEEKIGEEYLIPLIGVYDKFEDINFDSLPNRFVLKTTHDSGGVVVCKDKDNFDVVKAKEKLNKSLKRNYYNIWREWPYKNVKPKIICEEFLETKNGGLPIDYKFHCFNGVPDNVMLCVGRETGKTKFYFFNKEWKLLKYNITGKEAPKDFTLDKPEMMDKMFEIAKILSRDLTFVRVDLYCENNKIYFGELTFFPETGLDSNLLEETDLALGDMIKIKGDI